MKHRLSSLHVAVVMLALAASPVLAGQSVPVDKLDAKVTEAIKKKFPEAELVSAERETEQGKTKYEVKIRHQGANWEVDVTPNGEIIETERDD
jgi:uncharacterized membrane protein YkoI